MCNDWDCMDYLQCVTRQEGNYEWITFHNDAVCEFYNSTRNKRRQCSFGSLKTAPCKQEMYTVSTVPNKCEYKIKSFNINGKSIHKVKVAVFTCKFEDPHGTLEDTTPLFRYWHPYDRLTTDKQNSLSPSARAILDSILETRQDKLIPLKELCLNDFFPNFHPALATEEGHPLHFHDNLARLVIHHKGPKVQE